MLDDYRPPTLRDRLLHPYAIAGLLLVVVFGGFWAWGAYERWQRAALVEALAPLEAKWDELRLAARPRLAAIEAVLVGAASPTPQSCGALAGPVEVVHRPILQALATGTRFPRGDAPAWLSTRGYMNLSEASTPGDDLVSTRRRNDRVRALLDDACVVVLETDVANPASLQPDRTFEGGDVSGWARIVCRDPDRVACQVRVQSQPWIAVAVVQHDRSNQTSANTAAVGDAARGEYEDAMAAALREIGPGLTLAKRDR